MKCPEITVVVRTYQVCALTMFALSQTFRVIVLEHKPYVHLWQSFSETTLYTVRLQLYISCAMIFTLVSIIYPRIPWLVNTLKVVSTCKPSQNFENGHIMVVL